MEEGFETHDLEQFFDRRRPKPPKTHLSRDHPPSKWNDSESETGIRFQASSRHFDRENISPNQDPAPTTHPVSRGSGKDYIESRMLCRIMHTKRGNLWNELHKLDKKRITLLLNKFVVQKDHEAMQYIIDQIEQEMAVKHNKMEKRRANIQDIKSSKKRQKANKLKRLKCLEKKNFESVVRYLGDRVPREELLALLRTKKRGRKGGASLPKKSGGRQKLKYTPNKNLKIGNQQLFQKLTDLNNDLYQEVYQETQKKFSDKGKRSRAMEVNR